MCFIFVETSKDLNIFSFSDTGNIGDSVCNISSAHVLFSSNDVRTLVLIASLFESFEYRIRENSSKDL